MTLVMNLTPGLEIRGATDIGLKRSQNEDHYGWWVADPRPGAEDLLACVVADGMGGASAGEVASRLAVDCVIEGCRERDRQVVPDDLGRLMNAANRTVYEQGLERHDQRGMGTTCTALLVRGRQAWFAHVGDSRVYLLRDGALSQVTRDHSLVAQLVEGNHITPEQARVDPRRNVVTRCLGVAASVEVDLGEIPGGLRPGDTLVLSTDGLHGVVEDRDLLACVSDPDLDEACRRSIALAREHGGPDNITLVAVRVSAPGGA